jgi:hypothetical protein
MKYKTREQWLVALAKKLEKLFKEQGHELPAYRVTCGFPSKGGLAVANRTIGQCWYAEASADDTTEIIISITQDDTMRIAGVLAHELVHAALGAGVGHSAPFKHLATAIGLEGKMTATTEGERFIERVQPMIDAVGSYPHARLDASGRKKQGTRMLKAQCNECDYTVRTTQKWIEVATPICPNPDCGSHGEEMEIS